MTLESDKPCHIFNQHGQTRRTQHNSRKSRCTCVVEAHESARTSIGAPQPRDHEDLIAEKGFNSLSHSKNLLDRPSPIPPGNENSGCDSRS